MQAHLCERCAGISRRDGLCVGSNIVIGSRLLEAISLLGETDEPIE